MLFLYKIRKRDGVEKLRLVDLLSEQGLSCEPSSRLEDARNAPGKSKVHTLGTKLFDEIIFYATKSWPIASERLTL